MRLALMLVTLSAGLWYGCGGSSGKCTGTATACESLAVADCAQQAGCDTTQSCAGLAVACFQAPDAVTCGGQDGCAWNMACTGTAVECLDQATPEDCAAIRGCTWNDNGGGCTGVIPSCFTFIVDTDHDDCTPQPGCSVQGTCTGTASACVTLDADTCATQAGCTQKTACAGTVSVCGELKTLDQCAAQGGCAWEK